MASPTEHHPSCETCSIDKFKRMASMFWKLARNSGRKMPSDVPPGHVAVLIGEAYTRKVIRSDYLNLPIFSKLLDQAYEEYGHQQLGLLAIPCTELLFSVIISRIEFTGSQLLYPSVAEELEYPEFLPLLQGSITGSIC